MKISKVNHIKTAIKVQDNETKGILYKNPTDGRGITDIEKHIDKQVENADRFGSKFRYYVDDSLSKEEIEVAQKKRETFKKNVKNSLENQNMIIQPVELDNDIVLALSLIKGEGDNLNVLSRKAREKAAFRRFLSDYANLDYEYRIDILRKIRRIVLLYFYGPQSINEEIKAKFDVWDDHKARRDDTSWYIEHSFVETKNLDKRDAKNLEEENYKLLAQSIRNRNIRSYRESVRYVEDNISGSDSESLFFEDKDLNEFWIHHIENEVERIYAKHKRINRNNTYKLCKGYISEKVWKGIINYICIKYVALGKVVFNMAMEDINSDGDENLGVISDAYKNGISSFDYELIKAEERLQRETAVYTSFAINNFLTATIDKTKDDYDISSKSLVLQPNVKRNILQYYGGESRWENFGSVSSADSGEYLWNQIKMILEAMRNESFHFKTKNYESGWDKNLITEVFKVDSKECNKTEVSRFYSNNVPMFYGTKDIENLMHKLYDRYTIRASQVPAFNTVFVRMNFPDIVKSKFHINLSVSTDTDRDKYHSALYYMLKEIYYNAFLNDDNTKKLFIEAVKKMKGADKNQEIATRDFKNRIKEIDNSRDYSLSEICQIIMTEFNQQNDQWAKKRTNKGKKKRPEGYQHYRVLLFEGLRNAFVSYIEGHSNDFGFINNPRLREMPPENEFLADFATDRYNSILKDFETNMELQKWYVMGRFLNPKQVNYLGGCFKNYIQYKWDISRRAEDTGNRISLINEKSDEYEKILQIIEICTKLNGSISRNIKDYFDDEDDYAKYVAGFLDYESSLDNYEISPSGKLKEFCKSGIKETDEDSTINIYYDGENPILNRNIILSKLYGNGQIIADVLSDNKVTLSDIHEYYKSMDALSKYRANGTYKDENEVKNLKRYQDIKNHVEFRDLVEYAEIMNELQGQLINFVFLRERDLMYFQLGFHYSCLKNDSYKPEDYKKIEVDSKVVNNAILHQLVALYINGIHLYVKNKEGLYIQEKDKSAGGNISGFADYCADIFKEYEDKYTIYKSGLELFENINEHDNIVDLRNYIDHFKYFTIDSSVNDKRSIMGIYSEIFDRFFTYDLKYHKNVPNVMFNILMGHFAAVTFDFSTGVKFVDKKKNGIKKDCASIKITKVEAEPHTYKVNNKKVEYPARNEVFLKNVISLLYYRDKDPEVTIRRDDRVKAADSEKKLSQDKGNKNNKGRDKKRNQTNRNNKESGKLTSNPFDTFLDDILL